MTPKQAVAFVRMHGIVLEAASGPLPSLTQAIAGDSIRGTWWAHPQGRQIFQVTRAVRASHQILVCRLIGGKVTLVHQRLWPALVRCAARFRPEQVSQLVEEHTQSGRHWVREIPFPEWVPAQILEQARGLTEEAAFALLGAVALEAAGAT